MQDLTVTGKQKFMGLDIPVVLGGFGEGKKCISDKTVAEIYGMKVFHVRELVSNNLKRFKENIDLIDIKQRIGADDTLEILLNLGYAKQSITQAEHIYILSERGYAKLIKIMDTDLAWEIHDKLMDEYFQMREEKKQQSIDSLSPQLQFMINVELKQKEQDAKLSALDDKISRQDDAIQSVKQAMANNPDEDFSHWVTESLGRVANSPAFDSNPIRYQAVRSESYRRLSNKSGCRLDTLLKNAKDRAAKSGATKTQIKSISKISVIAENKRLKELYIACIREMMVAYCIDK